MQLIENILLHGSIYAIILTVSFLVFMKYLSPRVWAMSDYSPEITSIVEPQTREEKRVAILLAIPMLGILFIVPVVSTILLEATYSAGIPLFDAFLNTFMILMFGNLADLVILDILVVGTWTPSWVVIPGTEHLTETAYKDFRGYHTKGHVRGTIMLAVLSVIISLVIVLI